ncbi:MAG TPA: CCC motif membrane protein [Flavobacterium sp.]|nr:CCC motif membrane protein [Flavobacterium sp.]
MENYQTQQDLNNPMGDGNFMQSNLPNATAVLILGIISIIGTCCYGIIGLICGIIGLVLANKDMKLYRANPNAYSNYSNLNTGRILCIVGIILSVLAVAYFIFIFAAIGMDALSDPELLQERILELQNS